MSCQHFINFIHVNRNINSVCAFQQHFAMLLARLKICDIAYVERVWNYLNGVSFHHFFDRKWKGGFFSSDRISIEFHAMKNHRKAVKLSCRRSSSMLRHSYVKSAAMLKTIIVKDSTQVQSWMQFSADQTNNCPFRLFAHLLSHVCVYNCSIRQYLQVNWYFTQ